MRFEEKESIVYCSVGSGGADAQSARTLSSAVLHVGLVIWVGSAATLRLPVLVCAENALGATPKHSSHRPPLDFNYEEATLPTPLVCSCELVERTPKNFGTNFAALSSAPVMQPRKAAPYTRAHSVKVSMTAFSGDSLSGVALISSSFQTRKAQRIPCVHQ